jgi:non-ribosomal peptide synthetase component F
VGQPRIGSIADIPRVWGSLTPDKVALVEAGRAVTYGELDERSNRIANAIITAGVRPDAPEAHQPSSRIQIGAPARVA